MPNARLALYLTQSLLHIGTGEAVGDIDLPVVRQTTTGHPCLPSSAQKRALKDGLAQAPTTHQRAISLNPARMRALFGADAEADAHDPPGEASADRRGATGMLSPQEGLLLLLPLACGAGGCAWVTSPSVWQRFRRAAALAGVRAPALPAWPATDNACCPSDSVLCTRLQEGAEAGSWVVLGPAALGHQPPAELDPGFADPIQAAWADWAQWVAATCFAADDQDWQTLVTARLAIVSDTVFDLLLPFALVDRARNQVGNTVQLWREEAVPDNTVFYALLCAQPLQEHRPHFATAEHALDTMLSVVGEQGLPLQMGGNSSLGQGFMQLQFAAASTEHPHG